MGDVLAAGDGILGCVFLGGQVYEFGDFWLHEGMQFNSNLFSQCSTRWSAFTASTSLSGVWLIVMAVAGMMGKAGRQAIVGRRVCAVCLAIRRYRFG